MYEVCISHQTNFNDNSTSLDQDEECELSLMITLKGTSMKVSVRYRHLI